MSLITCWRYYPNKLEFVRTFFAIDFSPECKKHLGEAINVLKSHLINYYPTASFRWINPLDAHLTLQFIGEIKEEEVLKLLTSAREQLAYQNAFYLQLNTLEWFPSVTEPRVISWSVNQQETLTQLSTSLGQVMSAHGRQPEKRVFKPHVTLARVDLSEKANSGIFKPIVFPPFQPILIKEIILFCSLNPASSIRYKKLASIELPL
jgi:RNA 2',3'-cyclic 3'-phosphodiesterase